MMKLQRHLVIEIMIKSTISCCCCCCCWGIFLLPVAAGNENQSTGKLQINFRLNSETDKDAASTGIVTYNPSRSEPLTEARRGDVVKPRKSTLILRRSVSSTTKAPTHPPPPPPPRLPPPPPPPRLPPPRLPPPSMRFPVTFRSADAFLRFKWKIYATFSIQFQLRTHQSNGLVLFSGSNVVESDFLALEFVSGQIRYVFDTGGGPRAIQSATGYALSDGAWHDVVIVRRDLRRHVLTVDEWSAEDMTSQETKSIYFDLNDDVYVGGVSVAMVQALPRQLRSASGFHGCVASFTLNGKTKNLLDLSLNPSSTARNSVKGDCEDPSAECQRHVCENGGRCEQQWSSFKCDCAMTSFTGSSCRDESVAYSFGHSGGLVTFTFGSGEWPDTKTDQLALGLLTNQRNAVLVRITSGSSSDFLEMEMIDGNIFVVYNMGDVDHSIGDRSQAVNDDQYHVIRFMREGANASIQIDHRPPLHHNATGLQRTTFNHQKKIFVGGKSNESGKTNRAFHGTTAGLVVNGLRVFELAADGDRRVSIEGDVQLEVKVLRNLSSQKERISESSKRSKSPKQSSKGKSNDSDEENFRLQKFTSTYFKNSSLPLRRTPFVSFEGVGRSLLCASEQGNCSLDSRRGDDLFSFPSSELSNSIDEQQQQQRRRPNSDRTTTATTGDSLESPWAKGRGSSALPRQSAAAAAQWFSSGRGSTAASDPTAPTFAPAFASDAFFSGGSLQSIASSPAQDARDGGAGAGAGGDVQKQDQQLQSNHRDVTDRSTAVIAATISGLLLLLLLLLSLLCFGLYRFHSRDAGSYRIEGNDYTLYEAHKSEGNGSMTYRLKPLKSRNRTRKKKKTLKEWYV